jgi:3-methyladenine DNA glycosylase AlkD
VLWGICDSFCIGVVAPFLAARPALRGIVHAWAAADDPWLRRAGCVTLTKLCRALGRDAEPEVARMIDGFIRRGEREDLLHKAMGWLLKECASTVGVAFVERLIATHGRVLARVPVVHATERMPSRVRDRVRAEHARASAVGVAGPRDARGQASRT